MAATFVPIQSVTLASSAASVTFTGIPQTYTDLVVRVSARGDFAAYAGQLYIKYNASSTSDYSLTRVWGDGSSSTGSNRTSGASYGWALYGGLNLASTTANTFASSEIYISDYTGSAYKVASGFGAIEGNTSTANQTTIQATAALRSNTAAITSIALSASDGNLVAGSTFHLYGIKNS